MNCEGQKRTGMMDVQPWVEQFSRWVVSVVVMAKQTRSVSSAAGGRRSASSPRPVRQTTKTRGRKNNRTPSHRMGRRANQGSHRKQPKKRRHLLLKWTLGILGTLLVAAIGCFAYLYLTTEIVPPEKQALAQKTTVYYADGTTPIGTYADQDREIIDCSVLPKYVGNAVVASENRSFYKDSGIDLRGIGRALLNNVTKGTRQGGSTITQQYAERYYLGETTSYRGKLREAILALKISQTESKETVLCNYMNTIYFGRGAYGIQAAAQNYYGKNAKDLTMPESAMLAGIIPAPTTWDPAVSPKQAESRFHRVLGIMEEEHYISHADNVKAAIPQTINYSPQNVYQGPNGYLLRMVRNELAAGKKAPFTPDDLDTGGYRIVTTIQKDKQDLMFQVASPSAGGKNLPPTLQTGGLSVSPQDGSIIALYAGDDYLTHQLNNVDQATFQVGSTMKAYTLLGAIQDGVSLNTVFNGNSPRTFSSVGKSVANAGQVSYGYINLYSAFANSVNTVFMDLGEHVTSQKTAQLAHTAGITGKIDDTTTFDTLGLDALTVYDATQGYATLANGGKRPELHLVAQVKDSKDRELYTATIKGDQVFNPDQVALLQKAMTSTVQYGTGSYARSLGRPIAGKTGTANDETAISFIGFTPSVLTTFAVWNQGADGSAQKVPEVYQDQFYPVRLFTQYMKGALGDSPVERFPAAVDKGKIGGPDGTWGTGGVRNYTPRNYQTVPSQEPQQESRRDESNSTGGGNGNGGETPQSNPTESTGGNNR